MRPMFGTPKPEISVCVLDHLHDAIEQAAELHNSRAGQGLSMALELIEQNTEYIENDFEGYADRAITIAGR